MQKFLLSKHGAHGPVLATSTRTVSLTRYHIVKSTQKKHYITKLNIARYSFALDYLRM
jgi:hypothetical protein